MPTKKEMLPRPLQEEAFTEFVLERLSEHNEVTDWNLCSYEAKKQGQRPAAKFNAWSLSEDGATLDLFTTLYHGEGRADIVTRAIAEQQFKLVRGFLRRALSEIHVELDESQDAFQVARCIFEAKGSLTTVRLFVLTDGVVKSFEIDEEQIPGIELRYVLWDLEKLSQLHVGARADVPESGDAGGENPTAPELLARVRRLRVETWPALAVWGQKTSQLKAWEITFAQNLGRKLARGKNPSQSEITMSLAMLAEAQTKGFTF